ncbi:hypothetical protein [Streptomyces sp. gb1(2016)]|uniref:hypothetical protein n=1 Tax=unclassified Streptomyces TaxID=2593676 RepID=UPI0016505AFF
MHLLNDSDTLFTPTQEHYDAESALLHFSTPRDPATIAALLRTPGLPTWIPDLAAGLTSPAAPASRERDHRPLPRSRTTRDRVGAFAVVLAAGAGTDDPSVFVASDVDLALAAGERAGGELLDEAFIMTAPRRTATRGRKPTEATKSAGSLPGGRTTGATIRVTFVLSLRWAAAPGWCSA